MRHVQIFGYLCAAIAITAMFELVRRQNIKEKYAVLWAFAALGMVVVAVYPGILDVLADASGIRSGPNVLLLVGGVVVTLVCVQLSVEVSRLEDRSRALAEEIGLLRLQAEKNTGRAGSSGAPSPGEGRT